MVADWELDLLMRRRAHDYLVATSRTLHSLAQLLTTIENMVINDNVGQLVSVKSVDPLRFKNTKTVIE